MLSNWAAQNGNQCTTSVLWRRFWQYFRLLKRELLACLKSLHLCNRSGTPYVLSQNDIYYLWNALGNGSFVSSGHDMWTAAAGDES